MKTYSLSIAACVATLAAGCASGPPPAAEFPAGARAPSASEVTTTLRGKSFTLPSPRGALRTDYASEGNRVVLYMAGTSDTGSWRAEDGRVCYEWSKFPAGCNDLRLVGEDLYAKRTNGEVVKVERR